MSEATEQPEMSEEQAAFAHAIRQTIEVGFLALSEETRDKLNLEAVAQVVAGILSQGMPQLGQALVDLEGQAAEDKPYWGFRLLDRNGESLGAAVVPKKIDKAKGPEEILQHLTTLMLVINPLPHFLTHILGLRLEVIQTATPPPKHSKIIV